MKLTTANGITTRNDGLPYDVKKVAVGHYQFRATGNLEKPVVIATTKSEQEAILMLVAQAPEDVIARRINELTWLLEQGWATDVEKAKIIEAIAHLTNNEIKVGA